VQVRNPGQQISGTMRGGTRPIASQEGRRAATVYQLWLAGGPDAKEWID